MRYHTLSLLFAAVLFGCFQACICQEACEPCEPFRRGRRRMLDNIRDLSKLFQPEGNSTSHDDAIRAVIQASSEKVEAVTGITEANLLASEKNIGLKTLAGVIDTLSLSYLGFLHDLLVMLDAVPVVGSLKGAVIGALEVVDDVYFDVLDVVLVFLRDDVLGALISADSATLQSADAIMSKGIATADSLVDIFPPFGALVEGVQGAVSIIDDITSDPEAALAAVTGASNMTIEQVGPIVAPLGALGSIVGETLDDISCLLDDVATGNLTGCGRNIFACGPQRLMCSVQTVVFGGGELESASGNTTITDVPTGSPVELADGSEQTEDIPVIHWGVPTKVNATNSSIVADLGEMLNETNTSILLTMEDPVNATNLTNV